MRQAQVWLALAAGLAVWVGGASAASPTLRISQIYGGGGNNDALFKNDFIELRNCTATNIDLSGWSVQYASATGIVWTSTVLGGVVPAGAYYLVQEGSGGNIGATLPAPDATGTLTVACDKGKVALVAGTNLLTGANPATQPGVADFVGYGGANGYEGSNAATGPSGNNSKALLRLRDGLSDTDDNRHDFAVGPPLPRNRNSPALLILDPAPEVCAVAHDVDQYSLHGVSANLAGLLQWTNTCTGVSGQTAAETNWSIGPVVLGVGSNALTVSGSNAVGETAAGSVTLVRDAPGPLRAGDIAFVGWNDSADLFSFVALSKIPEGTAIHFTDNGWSNTQFRTGEKVLRWEAIVDIPAGTVVRSDDTSDTYSWVRSGGYANLLELNNEGGEQIYAFQGTLSNPTTNLFVLDDTGCFEPATDPSTGDVPPGLVTNHTAITFNQKGSSQHFMAFTNFPGQAKTRVQWLAAIADSNNWQFGSTGTLPVGSWTVQAPPQLTLLAEPQSGGSVAGGGEWDEGATVTIAAAPAAGYLFTRWSDGNRNAVRTLTMPGNDLTNTAFFASTATVLFLR